VGPIDLRKAMVLGMIPLAGGAILLGALLSRFSAASRQAVGTAPPKTKSRAAAYGWEEKPLVIAQPAARPDPAPEKTVAARTEDVRIRSTYQNYRTAVATNNSPLEHALRPVVLRDREHCLAIAQEELAGSRTDFERDVAQKVIESLRR